MINMDFRLRISKHLLNKQVRRIRENHQDLILETN